MDLLIQEAIPGKSLKRMQGIPPGIQRPLRLWASNATRWAIYGITGKSLPRTTEEAINRLKKEGSVKPCILVHNSENLGVVANAFVKGVSVIVEIGGRGTLIKPRKIRKRKSKGKQWESRIPPKVLEECAACESIDTKLRKLLQNLAKKYRRKRRWNDDDEQEVLNRFFLDFAALNGLTKRAARAQDILRRLERAGMGVTRDHYFHSFQNFFLGLWVVGMAKDYFGKWLTQSKLEWGIPFEFVWFLICMWHDVGYGVQSLSKIENDIFGVDIEEGDKSLSGFLSNPSVIEGKRIIASLAEHLLKKRPTTGWMPPRFDGQQTPIEKKLEGAVDEDVRNGHGAASALRLYTDMQHFISRCAIQDKRNILMQAAWMAAASIPFHDWHFRKCVREKCGICRIPGLTMPFAVLLTFVDSIQEDRRGFNVINKDKVFLQCLTLNNERIISAKVDGSALGREGLIWKIVDATDVLAAIETNKKSIDIQYPTWLVA